MDFAKQKTEGESGINGYRSLYSERCPLFCGRGDKTSVDCLYRTLTQSPTVPALSRREPWFERSLCAVCIRIIRGYRMLFTGGKQITPSKRTIALGNCRRAFPTNYKHRITSRNAPPLPYGRSVHSVRDRFVCGYHLFTKVDMFDLPCKSNSICKGRAFARYIRLATDSICFATGKTRKRHGS